MSRSSSSEPRGQVDPIPALLAVTVVIGAVTLFLPPFLDLVNATSERQLAEPTVRSVWTEIQDDGVYDETSADLNEILRSSGEPVGLPDGRFVYIRITGIDEDGDRVTWDRAVYGPAGDVRPDVLDEVRDEGVPESATTASRPIPVRVAPGRVRAGTLHVAVWNSR